MKKMIFALSAIALVSCKQEAEKPVDYALFSGKVMNKNADAVIIKGKDFSQEIKINEDGTFADTLRVANGDYEFHIGNERSGFNLNQGDDLKLSIDTKEFDETITYTGVGAEKNNYLAKSYLAQEKNQAGYRQMFMMAPNDFKAKMDAMKASSDSLLNAFKIDDADFVENAKKNAQYENLSLMMVYPQYYRMLNQGKEAELPENFLSELDALDLDNADEFDNSSAYKNLVMTSLQMKAQDAVKTDSTLTPSKALLSIVKGMKSENIKNASLKNLAYEIGPRNDDSEALYNDLMAISTDEEFKKSITEQFEKIKKITKGQPSPNFENYENFKGGTTSLADLKGKYVYIDVWATWCGPCKREIPHLKQVEKDYHGKNIEFVSISVDKKNAHETWKKMVADKELTGIQLFADNDFKSQFAVDYAINSIPRFIIVDPEGNIVDADAKRPSDPSLREFLDALDI